MRGRAASWVAVLVLSGCAGEGHADRDAEAARPIVSLGEISTVTVRPGESATMVVPVVVAAGYHVQANPAADEFLVPLELRLDGEPGAAVVFATPSYPPPGRHRLVGAEGDLLTYESDVRIEVPLTVSPTAPPGPRRTRGELRYQACDARRCYFPDSLAVELVVEVAE